MALQDVKESSKKKELLLNLGGRELRRISKGLLVAEAQAPASGGDPDVYKPLKLALEQYFKPKENVTAERYRFRNRLQSMDESVTTYVSVLRDMARRCKFSSTETDTVENCLIRDQLIAGLRSPEIRRELLTVSSLTLDVAVEKAVGMELSVQNAKLYGNDKEVHHEVDAVYSKPTQRQGSAVSGTEFRNQERTAEVSQMQVLRKKAYVWSEVLSSVTGKMQKLWEHGSLRKSL